MVKSRFRLSILLVTVILFILDIEPISAQSKVSVTLSNGTNTNVMVPEEGKIYFSEAEMYVDDGNGSIQSFVISNISKLQISTETGIGLFDPNDDNSLLVYPNPSSSMVTVVYNSQTISNVKIYSISGRLLINKQILSGGQIDVSFLPKGFYFLKVNNQTSKFVKQ